MNNSIKYRGITCIISYVRVVCISIYYKCMPALQSDLATYKIVLVSLIMYRLITLKIIYIYLTLNELQASIFRAIFTFFYIN